MPTLSPLQDGRYALNIQLPVGAHIAYKYTLGDGYWNAEHGSDSKFVIRHIVVPNGDLVIQDTVATWQAGTSSAPILFEVSVPATTPPSDVLYIQFNSYAWTEPIPMWALGNNRWAYKLFSPLDAMGRFSYRFCRNAQCSSADDAASAGPSATGRVASTSLTAENLVDTVSQWAWLPQLEANTVVAVPVNPRSGFVAGLEMQSSGYHPSWRGWMSAAYQNARAINANWIVLTPSWTAARPTPLIFEPRPGTDPQWRDVQRDIAEARALAMNVALFPTPQFVPTVSDWWLTAPRSPDWWNAWFDRYRAFALYYADLAAQNDAQMLILGGPWVAPALPGGILPNGGASDVPADAEGRWQALVAEVRARYRGQVLWAFEYRGQAPTPPAFTTTLDGYYILWNAPLARTSGTNVPAMQEEAARLMDADLLPFVQQVKKPVILGLNPPAASGASTACVTSPQGGCLDPLSLTRPRADIPGVGLNLYEQSAVYEAIFLATNERTWIGGLVSRGYYPPAMLRDKSSSVHGKPAADLLWYWFPRLTGAVR
jgi:hypothetical protein